MEQLPELLPRTFQGVRVVIPVAPACGNRLEGRSHGRNLPKDFEHLGVLVILNAITDGLQTDPRSGLARGDRSWRIQEDSIARSAQAAAASRDVHVVPTADGVPGSPPVRAIVENPRCALRPVQEPYLDALVDRRIIHHPF